MEVSQNKKIAAAIGVLPAELRDISMRWFERLGAERQGKGLVDDAIGPLAKLVACSDFAAGTLLREWRWFVESQGSIDDVPDIASLQRFVEQIKQSEQDIDAVKEKLRRFRHRFMLQVLWREVRGIATLDETLSSLSDLADRLLDAAVGFAERLLRNRYGVVRGEDGEPVSIVILGMGKLGGSELNFSSDIDLIFLFPTGAESDGGKSLSAQEYFTRLSRHIVALLDEVTADGFAFRIDTRLRPFGDSGPPVVSFAALESYLLQHGRGWERYAYVKARIVGPQPRQGVCDELYKNLVSPFVYRRYLDFGVFESLREMQGLIATEVKQREMADNIKLGPGGIREIEFIVQSLQLARGGSRPELQERGLLRVLPRLVGRHGLSQTDADELREAYVFLRRLENFIQALRDQQTHELATDKIDRARLCLAMQFSSWTALLADLDAHRSNVTRQFEAITFRADDPSGNQLKRDIAALWEQGGAVTEWASLLEEQDFTHPGKIAEQLASFAKAPGTRQIDSTARRRLQQFMPDLLLLIKESKRPVTALIRILAVVEKILRRSAYLALLNENSQVMARLVGLCERSVTIAEQIARYPVLLDELLDPRIFTAQVSREDVETELRERLAYCQDDDSEAQMALLGQFQRASLFRIAVADFSGNLPIMKVSDSLTELAETVLNHALHVAWQDMVARHGVPQYVVGGEKRDVGFAIIAYGKLGGLELSYGSDLDLVYLHDSQGTEQRTNGEKPLENATFFTRLVRRLVHFLTTQTGSGMLYEVDMRLRPDGQSGLLVSSVEAFERYQEENAWTWEHQALLRARPVAGSKAIAAEFQRIRADTLSGRVRRDKLREDVTGMRQRMRAKLDKSDAEQFDLKQGVGGIGDIEFIVQYLVLANADQHPAVFYYSDNIRQLETLESAGCIDDETSSRLQDVYKTYRLRLHHLILDDRRPLVSGRDFEAERAYVTEMWQQTFAANAS
ncbi:MAG: bifunctional [glutamate--ammonia ligase]-adenylyl-L-tyrosine phosphorylase/[glutamate--ammonia-ligase] adenylyltransferase [Gammaproteobacteria bacterium]|nr:bifunctional [glutamate--ammonia ligase]-adenylyl-L-tyrosine phosphorylase/[glutamate--ammonia-ligase] adenylyltransferase [Gammaproteobacteria bacterium]MDH3749733.1 bifunctional [glutamate--ammonia ligase]-adenylyl-L-tyrosine phosphorylase/[glutamate--ammonia-ligase] adenylyltransferase [Gammaproteobacteria bacterium]MDH3804456.1 bifunctional [glutamate--ammonia ligase]-adenylyl-L-tyrosine phosphorylase/[glutamate--ammonia-ligase] adenylyltransferase [Gammaproteobacteria bacterium]